MMDLDGVDWAAAAMGTPANLETLAGKGFDTGSVEATANDCFLAVEAASDDAVDAALEVGRQALARTAPAARRGRSGAAERPRSVARRPTLARRSRIRGPRWSHANLAIVSVPGDYAALEAHKALSAGLHVLLFSDNVPVDQEVELKERAEAAGLLVMGPGAGTAMLGGTGLGFANVVGGPDPGDGTRPPTGRRRRGRGRHRRPGGGRPARPGRRPRHRHHRRRRARPVGDRRRPHGQERPAGAAGRPGTDAVLLVSKPPSEAVARAVLAEGGRQAGGGRASSAWPSRSPPPTA